LNEHRRTRVATDEQAAERFDTDGRSFEESLRLVLAGGRDEESQTDERGADE
jgi:hypothetical protein